jgi:hypothetical protein
MARRGEITKMVLAPQLKPIQPVLDFWDDKAIVTTKEQTIVSYRENDGSETEYQEMRNYCILSTGKQFHHSANKLTEEGLFYDGKLDLPVNRWDTTDIMDFAQAQTSPSLLEMHRRIAEQFMYYYEFRDPRMYSFFPAFVIYTYFFPLFDSAPIIHLWGEFQTGKTKICSLLDALCFNPINSSNISSASVFRLVQGRRAVILLNESEDLVSSEKGKEIRNMLLAGTGKSGYAIRQEKSLYESNFNTTTFNVFSPKVIANISGIDLGSIQSRTIRIVTQEATNSVIANRFVNQEDAVWKELRKGLYRVCLVKFQDIQHTVLPDTGLSGRPLSIWKGILTIAHCIGSSVWDDTLSMAVEYAGEMKDELDGADEGKLLKQSLLNLVKAEGNGWYKLSYLADRLRRYSNGELQWTTTLALSVALRRIGLRGAKPHRFSSTDVARACHFEYNKLYRIL